MRHHCKLLAVFLCAILALPSMVRATIYLPADTPIWLQFEADIAQLSGHERAPLLAPPAPALLLSADLHSQEYGRHFPLKIVIDSQKAVENLECKTFVVDRIILRAHCGVHVQRTDDTFNILESLPWDQLQFRLRFTLFHATTNRLRTVTYPELVRLQLSDEEMEFLEILREKEKRWFPGEPKHRHTHRRPPSKENVRTLRDMGTQTEWSGAFPDTVENLGGPLLGQPLPLAKSASSIAPPSPLAKSTSFSTPPLVAPPPVPSSPVHGDPEEKEDWERNFESESEKDAQEFQFRGQTIRIADQDIDADFFNELPSIPSSPAVQTIGDRVLEEPVFGGEEEDDLDGGQESQREAFALAASMDKESLEEEPEWIRTQPEILVIEHPDGAKNDDWIAPENTRDTAYGGRTPSPNSRHAESIFDAALTAGTTPVYGEKNADEEERPRTSGGWLETSEEESPPVTSAADGIRDPYHGAEPGTVIPGFYPIYTAESEAADGEEQPSHSRLPSLDLYVPKEFPDPVELPSKASTPPEQQQPPRTPQELEQRYLEELDLLNRFARLRAGANVDQVGDAPSSSRPLSGTTSYFSA